ncbi:MAG: sigma-70 family RNA polymerase sigma factor [Terracidiphilus sp.]
MDTLKAPVNELARACAHSADAREWEELLRRCAPIAGMVAGRITRMWLGTATPSVVDDIVQEAFLKLCEQDRKILRQFEPRGEDSFFGLLRVVTASVANDYFRRQHSEKRGGKVVTTTIEDEPGGAIPALAETSGEMQRAVLFSELDQRLRSAPGASAERDRTIFWLYYLQGLTADEIAALPASDLTAKGVESALRRVTSWLRKELATGKPDRPVRTARETAN